MGGVFFEHFCMSAFFPAGWEHTLGGHSNVWAWEAGMVLDLH